MKTIKNYISRKSILFFCLLANMTSSFAIMPHLKKVEEINTGKMDGMEYLALIAKVGGFILIVVGSISLIYQGMNSFAGAMRSLRTEEGNMSNLTMHMVGALMSTTFGLVLGYLGYEILTTFDISTLGL
jgi:ABC-type transporter Mla maintaining outer membrane lipid asymmetry permease subunit MlaE